MQDLQNPCKYTQIWGNDQILQGKKFNFLNFYEYTNKIIRRFGADYL